MKTTTAMVCAALAAALTFSTAVEAKRLKISHVRPQDTTIDNELKEFTKAVEKATNGDIKIRIFAASALGDYTTVQERIAVGAIDMAVQPAATGATRKMQISSFPYLAEDWASARKVYGPGGAVREAMAELYAGEGITMLTAYPVYFGGISLNRDAVSPGDPNAKKGIKVRVPGIKSFQLLGDSLGYISSPIPFSEAFTAVQTGVVDGVIGSGAEGYYASFRDVTKTYIAANTHFEVWYMIINTETLNDLDAGSRDALLKAAAEFESKRWATAEADQAKNEKKLADNGAQIVQLSADQLTAMSKKVRAEVWPEILKDVGEDWGNAIIMKASK